jgi:hypothetical protein
VPLIQTNWESNQGNGAQGRNRTTDTAIFSLCPLAFVSLLDIAALEKIAIFSQLVC